MLEKKNLKCPINVRNGNIFSNREDATIQLLWYTDCKASYRPANRNSFSCLSDFFRILFFPQEKLHDNCNIHNSNIHSLQMHKMKTRPDKVCGSNRILIFSDVISVFMHVKSWKLNLKKKKKSLIYLKFHLKEDFTTQSFSEDYVCLSESVLNYAGRNLGQTDCSVKAPPYGWT